MTHDDVNVAGRLTAMARLHPDQPAVILPHGRDRSGRIAQLSYTELDTESDHLARGLAKAGIERGTRTVLMVPPSLPFFAVTFALFKLGAVIVLIDPGMGVKNLGRCLGEAEPEAFIGTGKAHLARRLLGWARKTVRITVSVGRRFGCQFSLNDVRRIGSEPHPPVNNPESRPGRPAEEQAAILFTSGSTGIAKGAVYTHGMFAAQVEALRRLYDIQPGEIELATFPLFALFAPALGMTAIIPDMDTTRPARADSAKIMQTIKDFSVTNLFGSPALIDRVGRYGVERSFSLPSLRRVISAGAPVSAKVVERFTRLLSPGAQVHTPYGATEALPVSSIGSDEILNDTRFRTDQGAGICVGRPVPGIDVAIIPISDTPLSQWDESLRLPAGQIGEITVYGPQVTQQYFNRPEATLLAQIPDEARDRVWHRMGDVGYLDNQGRLWMCGRKSQRVSTPVGEMYTIPCEAIFNTHPAVFRSALVGVGPQGKQWPVLCVELESNFRRTDRATLTGELLEIGAKQEHTRAIRDILYHPAFPVDIRHNAKIAREKLAAWAARRVR